MIYTGSLCSLKLVPRISNFGIIVDCGDQCGPASSFPYNGQCANLFNTLGIVNCNQPECSQRVYDLSACITTDTATNNTDSLCILRLLPHPENVQITVNCGDQCGLASSLQYDGRCANFFNTLGIERCYQTECNQTEYDLSACITASTEITTTTVRSHTTTNQNANCQCNRDRDAHTNSIATTGRSVTQACTPTIVYRTETINGSGMVKDNQPLPLIAALTIIIVILIMLLVTVSIALIWTCWKPKLKRGLKRDKQQAR